MSIIVSNCQHCDEQQFQTLVMCTLHDILSSKSQFIHTSTDTGLHSCSEKKCTYASRTSWYAKYDKNTSTIAIEHVFKFLWEQNNP